MRGPDRKTTDLTSKRVRPASTRCALDVEPSTRSTAGRPVPHIHIFIYTYTCMNMRMNNILRPRDGRDFPCVSCTAQIPRALCVWLRAPCPLLRRRFEGTHTPRSAPTHACAPCATTVRDHCPLPPDRLPPAQPADERSSDRTLTSLILGVKVHSALRLSSTSLRVRSRRSSRVFSCSTKGSGTV